MNKKRILAASFMAASLLAPFAIRPAHTLADGFYSQQNNADSADITNWVANSPAKISQNMQSQHIDVNNLNGTRYVIQWGDTLSGISAATGIPVQKIAYDNNIHNINLIYAGDVLILNRDGSAPVNWNIYGNGNQVAQTRVTINCTDNSVNFFHFGDNNHVRITNNVVGNDDNNDNGNDSNNSNSKTEYEAPSSAKEGLASAKSADNVASSQQAQSPAVSSNKPVNDDTDNQQSANGQPAGNSKADTAKSNDDNNDQNDDSSSSTMSTTDFENKVQDDINQDLNNDGGNSSINFTSYSDDDDSSSSSSSSNGNTTQLYDNDQNFTLKSTKMTDKNAQKLADKIIKRLKSDNKLDDLKNADNVQITISSDDNGFNVNFNVTSQSSSSSSDDQGQQSANNQQADDQNNDDDDD